jgi:ABC-type multidrug transport system fused ATPase/permease subunit
VTVDNQVPEVAEVKEIEPLKSQDSLMRKSLVDSLLNVREEQRQSVTAAITNQKEPIKLTWHNLNYTVSIKNKDATITKKKVLQDCSGYANPGQTLYIMGASGAGKTSLMNALTDRIAVNQDCLLSGDRLCNDTVPLSAKLFGSFGVYVMQDDIIFKSFTVKEALTFAARLRLKCSEEE